MTDTPIVPQAPAPAQAPDLAALRAAFIRAQEALWRAEAAEERAWAAYSVTCAGDGTEAHFAEWETARRDVETASEAIHQALWPWRAAFLAAEGRGA